MREQGDPAEARRLEATQLAAAIDDARAAHGAGALSQTELERIYATESARAAEAVILAELLVQQLAGRWPTLGETKSPDVVSVETAAPSAAPLLPRNGPPEIADFLDAMLANDHASRRTPRTART